ncbi:hypothetical protein F0562_013823 [Nyssa sinensis]|uniref:Uncharacterized protein n=1 Tax=Nyssa sinensis TaxID=561372 RepID=A0A5J4ZL36_9ASTE|nr:hypothetical protein F0562_013823 [Nyssa sinensis]
MRSGRSNVGDGDFWIIGVSPQHLIILGSLMGLLDEAVALVLGVYRHFVCSEVVDSELSEAAIGPKLAMEAAGPELAMAIASSKRAVGAVESVQLNLVDSELNFSQFGSESRFAMPWCLSFD